jgi:hypothetical protein
MSHGGRITRKFAPSAARCVPPVDIDTGRLLRWHPYSVRKVSFCILVVPLYQT